jgi:DNA helicase IV
MLLFEEQKRTKTFDRFDITLLLNGLIKQEGKLKKEEEYFERKKEFEVMRKKRKIPLSYAFIVIDEVQNYLPEQINILRSCISKDTNAMLYVGDLRQQILLGTLTTWEEASESFTPERKVELEKVYRSTKRILSFINDLGFATSIPDGMRDGQAVQEEHHENETSELQRIKEISREPDDKLQTGIIGFSEEYLEIFKKELTHIPHFHIMTAQQAQGVEFDRVFLVGIAAEMLISEKNIPQELEKNLKKIRKDLLYVALTRAIEELYIFGKVPLKTLASSLL